MRTGAILVHGPLLRSREVIEHLLPELPEFFSVLLNALLALRVDRHIHVLLDAPSQLILQVLWIKCFRIILTS